MWYSAEPITLATQHRRDAIGYPGNRNVFVVKFTPPSVVDRAITNQDFWADDCQSPSIQSAAMPSLQGFQHQGRPATLELILHLKHSIRR